MERGTGRVTRGSSKSPARAKKPAPKPKSPARTKSPARPKSPGRRKSPTGKGSPGRPRRATSKSPGRPKSGGSKSPRTVSPRATRGSSRSSSKTVSPARKATPVRKISPIRKISPVRKITQTTISQSVSQSFSIENSYKEKESRSSPFVRLERKEDFIPVLSKPLELSDTEVETEIVREPSSIRERSVSVPKPSTSSKIASRIFSEESTFVRRSSRLKRDEELNKISKVMNAEVDKILKANNVPLPPLYERKFGEKPVREFGSWPGALLSILLLPALALALHMSCTKSKCQGVATPSLNWRVYLDPHTAGYFVAFVAWQVFLSSVPLGRKASYGDVQVRLSGFYNALLTLAAVAGFYYYGFNVTAVLGKSVALLTSAILTSLVLALLLFFKGGRNTTKRNLNADGNKIYDFFIGREVLPTLGPLNIKALVTRLEFVGILLLNTLYLLKYVETHAAGVYSPTLLFIVGAHTLYVFDTLWFEEKFMTSFEAQYEGVGYMSAMAAATWPFLLTLPTRYVFYSSYEAPTYLLVICGIVFFLGYFVYRASNSQKAEFRKNPQHPVFAKYETISTFHGKRLLCGGWWGLVRHPNYLGDMLMMWSIPAVCGLSHWLPYVFAALHSAVLIHRVFRVGTRCKGLYGAAWDRYTQLVKYRLVPRVF